MTPENQRDEDLKKAQAQLEADRFRAKKLLKDVPVSALKMNFLIEQLVCDYQIIRQSWEREKEELTDRAYRWMKLEESSSDKIESLEAENKELINYRDACELKNYAIDALTAESDSFKESWEIGIKEIAQLRAEKKGLEERVKIIEQDRDSWRRCAERLETEKTEPKLTINIEESAIKELFKNQAQELTRLKAENERLLTSQTATFLNGFRDEVTSMAKTIHKQEEKIDTLTHALAEARGFMTEIIKEHKENEGEIFYLCQPDKGDVFSKYDNIAVIAKDALSNPTSQRASEEMKGLRKVVEAARLSNKECRKWRSNPDEKPCHEFKSLVDNDLLCHGCRLMNRIEALEAYESRGKV